MKFSIGDQVKIDCKGAPYHLCYGVIMNHITPTMYEIDVLGILVEVDEMYLRPFKIAFRVGDIIGSHGNSFGTQYEVIELNCGPHKNQVRIKHHESNREWVLDLDGLYLIDRPMCQHDWKRIDLFRTTEFHCPKCKTMRPFDITRDVA